MECEQIFCKSALHMRLIIFSQIFVFRDIIRQLQNQPINFEAMILESNLFLVKRKHVSAFYFGIYFDVRLSK
jgi:hypothetical protein